MKIWKVIFIYEIKINIYLFISCKLSFYPLYSIENSDSQSLDSCVATIQMNESTTKCMIGVHEI